MPDLASRGRQLLQKSSCFALNLMACGQFAQTLQPGHLGSLGMILPSRVFQSPTFLLLPALCLPLTWFCLLGCGRKTPISNRLRTAVTKQQCWSQAAQWGRQGVGSRAVGPGLTVVSFRSPVPCWVKERSLHFWREGNHRGDLQMGNALTEFRFQPRGSSLDLLACELCGEGGATSLSTPAERLPSSWPSPSTPLI